MELLCVDCKTKYEFDQFSQCPKCKSDKAKVVSEIDPWWVRNYWKARAITAAAISIILLIYAMFSRYF